MSLHLLAYNFRRLLALLGMASMIRAIRAYARFLQRYAALGDVFFAGTVEKTDSNLRPPAMRQCAPQFASAALQAPRCPGLIFFTAWVESCLIQGNVTGQSKCPKRSDCHWQVSKSDGYGRIESMRSVNELNITRWVIAEALAKHGGQRHTCDKSLKNSQ